MKRHVNKQLSVSGVVKVVLGCFLFFLLVTPPFGDPALAQPPPHTHNWTVGTPLEQPYIWFEKEYLRRGDVTALYVASIMDWDLCTNPGCSFGFGSGWAEDWVYLVSWSDNGAGGQFGYLDAQGNFEPRPGTAVNEITHYKASDTQSGVVHITLTVDDFAITQDPITGEWIEIFNDTSTTNPMTVGNLTVWEFTISNGAAGWGRPERDKNLSFTANITPDNDHYDNPMASRIEFRLTGSQEPGWCLNATRIQGTWTDTSSTDNDLKFVPGQAGLEISDFQNPNGTNFDTAWTLGPETTASVAVRCLDYGAYGWIEALTDLPDAPMAPARREGTAPPNAMYGAQIPIDERGTVDANGNPVPNNIADVWQWDNGGAGDDNEPGGDPNFRGDGFTRYEEYRGFKVNGAWQDGTFNPDTNKDVFVLDWDGLGTSHFANLGVTIHNLNTVAAQDEYDNFANHVMNYQHCNHVFHHRQEQHGILLRIHNNIVNGQPAPGGTVTRLNGAAESLINVQLIQQNFSNVFDPNTGQWVNDFLVVRNHTVAHELGHACNLNHHGYVQNQNGQWVWDGVTTLPCTMVNAISPQRRGDYVGVQNYDNGNPGCIRIWRLY